jgi:threonine-phosphate decarboxylase
MNSDTFQHGGTVFAVARQLGVAPEEILDFSASINPLGPAPGVSGAVAAAFSRVVHYPDSGCHELRQALARHHGLEAAQVVVANGSTELIHLLPRLVPARSRRALLVAPAFSEYAHALDLSGWRYDYLPLRPATGFALDKEQLAATLDQGYDLLFLGNPGNPSGRLYCLAEVEQLLDLCRDKGVFALLDEAFMDFCEEESAKRLALARDNVLVLRSMTKFYGFPGLRLGYALGKAEHIGKVARHLPPWSVGVLAQAAGLAGLADRAHGEETRQLVTGERSWLAAELGRLPGLTIFPGAANYLLGEMGGELTATMLAEKLLPQRILIRTCGNFAGLGERFFRVAVRSRGENEILVRAMGELLS